MHEEIRSSWSGFVGQHTTERISFREWNGDRLAQLLMSGVLHQEVLEKEHRALFQKALAMFDQAEVSYHYFFELLQCLLDDVSDERVRTRRLRQAYICLWILFVWARDGGNLEAAYRISELLLVFAWPDCDLNTIENDRLKEERAAILDRLLRLHLIISELLLSEKVGPLTEKRFALSMAVRSRASADINIALFETLGRLAMYGIWMDLVAANVSGDQEAEAKEKRDKCLDMAIWTIKQNPALLSPLRDDYAIEISLFMILAQLCDRIENVAGYVASISNRLCFSLELRFGDPTISHDYRELVAHPADRSDEYFQEHTRASVLYPLIVTWLSWLGMDEQRERLAEVLAKVVPHTTHQIWLPDEESDRMIWSGQRGHGIAVPGIPLFQAETELLSTLQRACEDHTAIETMGAIRSGFWPMLLAACRHYRLPIPPQLWQASNVAQSGDTPPSASDSTPAI